MTSVGVVAHAEKRLGGGLAELRKTLAEYGINDPPWHEVPKSKYVADRVDGASTVVLPYAVVSPYST